MSNTNIHKLVKLKDGLIGSVKDWPGVMIIIPVEYSLRDYDEITKAIRKDAVDAIKESTRRTERFRKGVAKLQQAGRVAARKG